MAESWNAQMRAGTISFFKLHESHAETGRITVTSLWTDRDVLEALLTARKIPWHTEGSTWIVAARVCYFRFTRAGRLVEVR